MIYFKYLYYILNHKWDVGIECIKLKLYWHAITHDLSKFYPSEFKAYAKHFYAGPNRSLFETAWCLHQHRNKHHWEYWVKADGHTVPMPEQYVKQMVADWKGMARNKKFDPAGIFYIKNKYKMKLHKQTKACILKLLYEEIYD